MTAPAFIMGIDPDTEKSGVAVWDCAAGTFRSLSTVPFWDLIDLLATYGPNAVYVVVEAGWLNKKSNYHFIAGEHVREKVAKNTGSNHEVGRKLVEWLDRYKYGHVTVRPKSGRDSKWNAEQFKVATGLKKGYNPEIRDAVRVMWPYRAAATVPTYKQVSPSK